MVVITGGAGFIGSVLVWKFNQLGFNDILVVDQHARESAKWKNIEKRTFSDYLEHDAFLSSLKAGKFDGQIKAIIHMGACSDTTQMDREYLKANNFEYSRAIAEWSVKKDCRFLYASSGATYGAGERGYCDKDSETPYLKPLNPYGESKQQFDLWVLQHRLEQRLVGFKFFNVFGPNEYHKGRMRSMVHKGYGQVKEHGQIRLFKSYREGFNDGEQLRDFVYVKDVASVVAWFWEHPDTAGIYNIGSGQASTWNQLAKGVFQALGRKPNIEYIPMPESIRDQYQYRTEADLGKLREAGCSHSFMSLEEAERDYITGYLEKADPYL